MKPRLFDVLSEDEVSRIDMESRRILADCEGDTVVVRVRRLGDGLTCHTGARSCFNTEIPLAGGAR